MTGWSRDQLLLAEAAAKGPAVARRGAVRRAVAREVARATYRRQALRMRRGMEAQRVARAVSRQAVGPQARRGAAERRWLMVETPDTSVMPVRRTRVPGLPPHLAKAWRHGSMDLERLASAVGKSPCGAISQGTTTTQFRQTVGVSLASSELPTVIVR